MGENTLTVFGQASVLRLTNNGTVSKVTITFSEHEDKDKLWTIFKDPRPIAIVPLTNETDIEEGLKKRDSDDNFDDEETLGSELINAVKSSINEAESGTIVRPKNQLAKYIYQSNIFRCQDVWERIGTDEEFLNFIRNQNCAYCKKESPSEAAHVRRIANGAGEGIKPSYSAIPLCHECHSNQHQNGESELGGKEWFDKMRIKYVHLWCWETAKIQIGINSWSEITEQMLLNWAKNRGIYEYVYSALQHSKSRMVNQHLQNQFDKAWRPAVYEIIMNNED